MALPSVRRATDKDVDVLSRLCADATGARGTLWSARRQRLNPTAWLAARAPIVVVGDETGIYGFAVAIAEDIPVGVAKTAEALVYVFPSHRRRGAGRAAMSELISALRQGGFWKVLAYSLPQDAAARGLLGRLDFREVGTLVKHVQIDGGWQDIAVSERLVLAARRSMPSISDG